MRQGLEIAVYGSSLAPQESLRLASVLLEQTRTRYEAVWTRTLAFDPPARCTTNSSENGVALRVGMSIFDEDSITGHLRFPDPAIDRCVITDTRLCCGETQEYGFADPGARVAIVSTYGIPQQWLQHHARIIALHEVGHLGGLHHHDKAVPCPMAHPRDVDSYKLITQVQKPQYCRPCRRTLRKQ